MLFISQIICAFLHRLLHSSIFIYVSYFHHLIIFLIHRLKFVCDFIKNIEYFTVKADFRTLFSIPRSILKKKFFRYLNNLLCR